MSLPQENTAIFYFCSSAVAIDRRLSRCRPEIGFICFVSKLVVIGAELAGKSSPGALPTTATGSPTQAQAAQLLATVGQTCMKSGSNWQAWHAARVMSCRGAYIRQITYNSCHCATELRADTASLSLAVTLSLSRLSGSCATF